MRTINIFLASSNELADERKAFETFISRHGNTWIETRETRLKLRFWEDFYDAVAKTRKQDQYDQAIEESQIFVMMFWTKVGMYTNEEFDVALARFKKTGFPLVYTYFKNVPGEAASQPSLKEFEEKLDGIGHFKTVFKSTEEFLLHFSMQLEKVYHKVIGELVPEGKTKSELSDMVTKMLFAEVIEELTKKFGNGNISLNILIEEYINPPNNFNQASYAQRLKVFITRNY